MRTLSLWDCVAIGVNGILGSGVYLLLGPLAAAAGPASLLGILLCAVACALIALCFVTLAGTFDASGGAQIYAEAAFGKWAGFVVGWLSLVTGVLAFAAVAAAFGASFAEMWPALGTVGGKLLSLGLVVTFSLVNVFGVRAGARVVDALSVAKLFPLVVLAVWGVFSVRGEAITTSGELQAGGVMRAAFIAVFMFSGFEFVPVPAGEAVDARHRVPLAIGISLGVATALYLVLQAVALSVLPDLATQTQPLTELARTFWGSAGAQGVAIAALISMAGFCAGSALVAPRYATALSERGLFPQWFSQPSKRGTPARAILTAAAATCVVLWGMELRALVDVTALVMFAQFLPTCVAAIVLRRRIAETSAFRLPGGVIIPVVASLIGFSLLIFSGIEAAQWVFAGQLLLIGVVISWLWRVFRGRWPALT